MRPPEPPPPPLTPLPPLATTLAAELVDGPVIVGAEICTENQSNNRFDQMRIVKNCE